MKDIALTPEVRSRIDAWFKAALAKLGRPNDTLDHAIAFKAMTSLLVAGEQGHLGPGLLPTAQAAYELTARSVELLSGLIVEGPLPETPRHAHVIGHAACAAVVLAGGVESLKTCAEAAREIDRASNSGIRVGCHKTTATFGQLADWIERGTVTASITRARTPFDQLEYAGSAAHHAGADVMERIRCGPEAERRGLEAKLLVLTATLGTHIENVKTLFSVAVQHADHEENCGLERGWKGSSGRN